MPPLVSLAACGGGGGGGDENNTGGNNNDDVTDNTPDGSIGDNEPSDSSDSNNDNATDDNSGTNNGNITGLNGTWYKACGLFDPQSPEDDGYDIVTLTINGDQFTVNIENYIDAACSQPIPELPIATARGTITIGNDVITTNGLTATEADTNYTEASEPELFISAYDIFYIDGDNLYFGLEESEVPEDRPDTIAFDRVFVRQ